MNFKNSKTFYLIFLVIVLSVHTFILTTVLSTENGPTSNLKFDNAQLEDSIQNKKFKSIPAHQTLSPVNKVYMNNISK